MWERIFADLVTDKKNQYLMIDSTIVRAHQQAATGRKKGAPKTRLWGVPEVALSTKIHLLADERGLPVAFRITAGQAAEYAQAIHLLEGPTGRSRDRRQGYDSSEIVTTIEALGAVAVIPPRRHWKQPRSYDRTLYKQRNLIERCFNRLKQFRRFSTRYCRNIEAFRSCTALACAWLRLQLYVDTA